MSLFRSEEDVAKWCRRTGEARGEVLSLERVWRLALVWYARRMAEDYHGRSNHEVHLLFVDQGLASDFWRP